LEAENKSAKPYSSRRTPEGPEKLNITFSYLLSPFSALDLSENRRRIDERTLRGMSTLDRRKILTSLPGTTMTKIATFPWIFLWTHMGRRC